MDKKNEILEFITKVSALKLVTKTEVIDAYERGSEDKSPDDRRHIGVAEVMSYLGGGIVVLGIFILIAQNWTSLSFMSKVLATLGVGLASYAAGLIFDKKEQTHMMSTPFFLISALTLPIGLWVILDNAGIGRVSRDSYYSYYSKNYTIPIIISLAMLVTYLSSFFIYKKNVMLLFSIIFGSWFFVALTDLIVSGNSSVEWRFYFYQMLALGVSYLALGYYFSNKKYSRLTGALYNFGTIGVLLSAIALGGWKPDQDAFWEMMYLFLIAGAMYAGIKTRFLSFIIYGAIFLVIYIIKISSEYFASSVGWSFVLVIAGLLMTGVGYMTLQIKKKYID